MVKEVTTSDHLYKSQSVGSTLTEAILVLTILTSILTYSFSTLSLFAAKIWIEHSLYNTGKCVLKNETGCERKLRRQLGYLPWGRVIKIELRSTFDFRKNKIFNGEVAWCNQLSCASNITSAHPSILKIKLNLKESMWNAVLPQSV